MRDPPHEPLEAIVEASRDISNLAADVVQQPDALRRDRSAHLGCGGDPFDQFLRLVGGEQPIPHVIDQLRIEDLDRSALGRRARERPLERLLRRIGFEHANDRALDRGALERAHDRLLGRALDRIVDPCGAGNPLPRPGAVAEQSCREWPASRSRWFARGHGVMVLVASVGKRAYDPVMRTAVISDLHLGLGSGADLTRRADIREKLVAALEGTDRLVLLGDVLELRDRPLTEALAAAEPVMAALGEAMADGEIVVVAGNHDHHLIEPWLERRWLEDAGPLGLEQRGEPEGLAIETLCRGFGAAKVTFAYPGLWLRDDIYAIHGHYLDRHLTVPTIERLGVAAIEKTLGIITPTEDPLDPPGQADAASLDEYERVQTPVYALLFGLAQGTIGERRGGADPSARLWAMLNGGETRTARVRNWVLGSLAVPGAVGIANRLGLGPVRSELSSNAIGRAGFQAMAEACRVLHIDADHLVFGHTHWRGSPKAENRPKLWNTGQLGARLRATGKDRRGEPVLAGNDLLRRRRGAACASRACSTSSAVPSSPAETADPRGAGARCLTR